MSVAVTSLPVPLSLVIRTVLSLLPITRRNSKTARIRALRPTTTESMAIGVGINVPSQQPQCFELGNLFAERQFDAEVQRHVRAGATSTHAAQLHVRRIA